MDDIQKRLKEITDHCVESYAEWQKSTSDDALRETLQEHIHELRKVASRLEIEIAMSERDRMASKPIPIPPHRSSRQNQNRGKGKGPVQSGEDQANDDGPAVKKVVRRGRKPKAANGDD